MLVIGVPTRLKSWCSSCPFASRHRYMAVSAEASDNDKAWPELLELEAADWEAEEKQEPGDVEDLTGVELAPQVPHAETE